MCVACLLVPLLLCGRGVSRVLAAGGEGFPFPSRFSSRSIEGPEKKIAFCDHSVALGKDSPRECGKKHQ